MKILELNILSQNLSDQFDFYSNVLGIEVIEHSDLHAIFQFGSTRVCFRKRASFRPYHFAINIPSNQENQGLDWLKDRVEILTHEGNEIQNFVSWNAKAIYFYDRDGNIVEFIARKNLNNSSHVDFNAASLLEVSEIGIPVSNIATVFNSLQEIAGLNIYHGNMERFCAIGDEHGLFICVNKEEKGWFPTDEKAHSSDFEIKFAEQGRMFHLKFENSALVPK